METPGTYAVPGAPPPDITPARMLELLEYAYLTVGSKMLKHERKLPRAKTPHDKQFHTAQMERCREVRRDLLIWIQKLQGR